jgi:hypothetical protein
MIELNLKNLKMGDEVVSLRIRQDGTIKYGGIRYVGEFSAIHNGWRYSAFKTSTAKDLGIFPVHGGCRGFMSKNKGFDYYFSANPIHLQEARIQHEKETAKIVEIKLMETEKLREFEGKLKELLNDYGAKIIVNQTNEDDQGVEFEIECVIGNTGFVL